MKEVGRLLAEGEVVVRHEAGVLWKRREVRLLDQDLEEGDRT